MISHTKGDRHKITQVPDLALIFTLPACMGPCWELNRATHQQQAESSSLLPQPLSLLGLLSPSPGSFKQLACSSLPWRRLGFAASLSFPVNKCWPHLGPRSPPPCPATSWLRSCIVHPNTGAHPSSGHVQVSSPRSQTSPGGHRLGYPG